MAGLLPLAKLAATKAAPMLIDYGLNLLGMNSANREAEEAYKREEKRNEARNFAGMEMTIERRGNLLDQYFEGLRYYQNMVPAVAKAVGEVTSREMERQASMVSEFLQAQLDLGMELTRNTGTFAASQSGSGMLNNAAQIAAKMEAVPTMLNQIPLQRQLATSLSDSEDISKQAFDEGQNKLNSLWNTVKDAPTLPTFTPTQMPAFQAPHDLGQNAALKIGGIALNSGLGALFEKAPSITNRNRQSNNSNSRQPDFGWAMNQRSIKYEEYLGFDR
tara:strand:- start:9987 stop:10811 length:825 start_codon:yes stop_codon:yes gene_type:complete